VAWSGDIHFDSLDHEPLLRYFPELAPSLEALPAGMVTARWWWSTIEPTSTRCSCASTPPGRG